VTPTAVIVQRGAAGSLPVGSLQVIGIRHTFGDDGRSLCSIRCLFGLHPFNSAVSRRQLRTVRAEVGSFASEHHDPCPPAGMCYGELAAGTQCWLDGDVRRGDGCHFSLSSPLAPATSAATVNTAPQTAHKRERAITKSRKVISSPIKKPPHYPIGLRRGGSCLVGC